MWHSFSFFKLIFLTVSFIQWQRLEASAEMTCLFPQPFVLKFCRLLADLSPQKGRTSAPCCLLDRNAGIALCCYKRRKLSSGSAFLAKTGGCSKCSVKLSEQALFLNTVLYKTDHYSFHSWRRKRRKKKITTSFHLHPSPRLQNVGGLSMVQGRKCVKQLSCDFVGRSHRNWCTELKVWSSSGADSQWDAKSQPWGSRVICQKHRANGIAEDFQPCSSTLALPVWQTLELLVAIYLLPLNQLLKFLFDLLH